VPEEGARHLTQERLHDVQPGAMFRCPRISSACPPMVAGQALCWQWPAPPASRSCLEDASRRDDLRARGPWEPVKSVRSRLSKRYGGMRRTQVQLTIVGSFSEGVAQTFGLIDGFSNAGWPAWTADYLRKCSRGRVGKSCFLFLRARALEPVKPFSQQPLQAITTDLRLTQNSSQ
jgi:hypothetical protein